jgi:hypothetical protein
VEGYMSRTIFAVGFALVLLVALLAGAASAGPTATKAPNRQSSELRPSAELRNAVDTDGILIHARRF